MSNQVWESAKWILSTKSDDDLGEGILVNDQYPLGEDMHGEIYRGRYATRTTEILIQGADQNYATKAQITASNRGHGNDLEARYVDIKFYTIDKRTLPGEETTISASKIRIDTVVDKVCLEEDNCEIGPYDTYSGDAYGYLGYYLDGVFHPSPPNRRTRLEIDTLVENYLKHESWEDLYREIPTSIRFIAELDDTPDDYRSRTVRMPEEAMLWTEEAVERHREDMDAILATKAIMEDFMQSLHTEREEFLEAWSAEWIPGHKVALDSLRNDVSHKFATLKRMRTFNEMFEGAREKIALIRKYGSLDGLYTGDKEQIARKIESDIGIVHVRRAGYYGNFAIETRDDIIIPSEYKGNHWTKNGQWSKQGLMTIHELIDASETILKDTEDALDQGIEALRSACKEAGELFEEQVLKVVEMPFRDLGEFYCTMWLREGDGMLPQDSFNDLESEYGRWFRGWNFHDLSDNGYQVMPVPDAKRGEDNVSLTTEDFVDDGGFEIEGGLGDLVTGKATYTNSDGETVKISMPSVYVDRRSGNYSNESGYTFNIMRKKVLELERFGINYSESYMSSTDFLAKAVRNRIYATYPHLKRAIWQDGGSILWPQVLKRMEVDA